ncbi:hypothetical protein ACH5RR_034178 [Cinchona calisaya]|uniref:Peroxidase n=1 Tax=Cinchona calisaya TaxID=153742 RepID=A0ABD2YD55_9GENT
MTGATILYTNTSYDAIDVTLARENIIDLGAAQGPIHLVRKQQLSMTGIDVGLSSTDVVMPSDFKEVNTVLDNDEYDGLLKLSTNDFSIIGCSDTIVNSAMGLHQLGFKTKTSSFATVFKRKKH